MDLGSLPEIISGVTALLIAFGAGVRWMIVWSDRKVARVQEQLQQQYAERFAALEERVANQDREITHNRDALHRYLRHVGILEGLLRANGIEVPPMRDFADG